ncbi:MAG: ABC transporter substrate-binding protein [Chloroflexi bacterium]|nr:ABC transporter substrate-binding protein [Chloroflexota bacterium]
MDQNRTRKLSRRKFLEMSALFAVTVATGCTATATPAPAPPAAAATAPPTKAPATAPAAPPAAAPTTPPTVAPTVAGAAAGNTLTFATGSPWGSYSIFRPVYGYGYESNLPSMLTHDRLKEWGSNNQIYPGLAEKWEVSPDATKYTYHLRRDVKWQDGQPFSAKDVATTVKLNLTKATNINPLYWTGYIKGSDDFYNGKSDQLPGLQVKDDYTVTFELEKPVAGWDDLALLDFNILPDHIFKGVNPADIKEQKAEAWFKPELNIGTGPFKFVAAKNEEYVELAPNPTYWGGKPKLDRILFKNFGKTDTQLVSFQKGELDIWSVPPDYVDRAKSISNGTLYSVKRNYIRIFLVHYEAPYLADKRVRQALLYGMDRKSLCNDLVSGQCIPYSTYMEVDSWVASNLQQYEYNPEKAQQLLKDANWDPNRELKLVYYYNDTLHKDWMAAIQQQLGKIGVKVKLNYLEGTAVEPLQKSCDFDLLYQGWGFGHPEKYGPVFHSGRGRCQDYWDDPKVTDLFTKAQVTPDEKARRAIYDQIQQMVNDELPILPVVKFLGAVAVNNRVQGFNEDSQWLIYNPWFTGHNNAVNWSVKA